MGFDVSWHPISQREMHRWYFDRLPEMRRGDSSGLEAVLERYDPGKEKGHQGFCRKSYREMLVPKSAPTHPFPRPTALSWRRFRACSAPITTPGAGLSPS